MKVSSGTSTPTVVTHQSKQMLLTFRCYGACSSSPKLQHVVVGEVSQPNRGPYRGARAVAGWLHGGDLSPHVRRGASSH